MPDETTPDLMLRLKAVLELTGFSVNSIDRLVEEGLFPAPVRIGVRSRGWLRREILDWQARCIAERDAKLARKRAERERTEADRAERRARHEARERGVPTRSVPRYVSERD
jgi:prophage regulatory protein